MKVAVIVAIIINEVLEEKGLAASLMLFKLIRATPHMQFTPHMP